MLILLQYSNLQSQTCNPNQCANKISNPTAGSTVVGLMTFQQNNALPWKRTFNSPHHFTPNSSPYSIKNCLLGASENFGGVWRFYSEGIFMMMVNAYSENHLILVIVYKLTPTANVDIKSFGPGIYITKINNLVSSMFIKID
jgi:hypothetical protein